MHDESRDESDSPTGVLPSSLATGHLHAGDKDTFKVISTTGREIGISAFTDLTCEDVNLYIAVYQVNDPEADWDDAAHWNFVDENDDANGGDCPTFHFSPEPELLYYVRIMDTNLGEGGDYMIKV